MHTTTPAPHTPTPPATAKHNNTPRLRFAEFQEAVPTHPLSGIAEIVNEKIRVEAISSSSYVSTENLLPEFAGMAATGNLPPVISVTRFQPKDILISNIRPYLKKVWQADIHGGASNDVLVVRAKSHVDANYLAALLRSDHFIDYVMRGAKGVKMPRGEISMIREFPIPCPSDAEQQKIAACLTSLDTLITAQTQKLDTLKTHKKGLMQQLFPRAGETTPRLRFAEFRGEWDASSMSAIYSFKGNNSLSRDKLNYDSGQFKNIHYGDIHTKFSIHFRADEEHVPYVNDGELHSSIREENYCKVGDVIFADASEDIEDIGKAIEIIDTGAIPLLSGLHTILARPNGIKFAQGFGGYLFLSEIVKKQIQRESQGTKVLGLSVNRLGKVLLPYPIEIREQQKIAACLSSLDELITAQAQKVTALQTHKKGLMQQLFPAQAKASA